MEGGGLTQVTRVWMGGAMKGSHETFSSMQSLAEEEEDRAG